MDFQKSTPSTKVIAAPGKKLILKHVGGQSTFSLGWGDQPSVPQVGIRKVQQPSQSPWGTDEEETK